MARSPHGFTWALAAIMSAAPTAAAQSLLWIRQLGTAGNDYADGLASDGAGGAFITLGVSGGIGPVGSDDVLLVRFDGAGVQRWSRLIGTIFPDYARSLAPDGADGVYVAGMTTGNFGAPNAGSYDMWLGRYDGGGANLWVRQLGTSMFDEANAVTPTGSGGVFVAGMTNGSLGGPNAGPGSTYDGWIARFAPGLVSCYADCNGDDALTVADFGCFQGRYALNDAYADCDGSGSLTVADFKCF